MADLTMSDDEPSDDSSADIASGATEPDQAASSPITLVPVDIDPFAPCFNKPCE